MMLDLTLHKERSSTCEQSFVSLSVVVLYVHLEIVFLPIRQTMIFNLAFKYCV